MVRILELGASLCELPTPLSELRRDKSTPQVGRAGINCEKDFIRYFFDDLKMNRNEFFKSLKGCRSFVIEVVQFFEKPVKSGHQNGGEQVFFVLEMIIKEGFGRTCLLDNLNGGGSFIALFG